jgi:CheY-like chemotaxis protein
MVSSWLSQLVKSRRLFVHSIFGFKVQALSQGIPGVFLLQGIGNALLNNTEITERMTYYKKLLLIDDDQDDHEFFLEAINEIDSSITCTAYFDGEQALGQLRNNGEDVPDLIILDTNMPKLNGKQILAELKRIPNVKEVPVIMYSTFFSERDNVELRDLGAVHYLSKPSKFEEFRTSLAALLSRK